MEKRNVFNKKLDICSKDPLTGYKRNGCCESYSNDFGKHIVCARVSEEFLNFSLKNGNDLITPNSNMQFPGLKPGDNWCLCAGRWYQAFESNCAPKVILSATSLEVIKYIDIDILKKFALDLN